MSEKPIDGIWTLAAPDGRTWEGTSPLACVRAELNDRVPASVQLSRILAELAYPHHCAPEDVAALVRRLEALSDPEQDAMPSFENTDWRTLSGICARVIKYLNGDDWRATS